MPGEPDFWFELRQLQSGHCPDRIAGLATKVLQLHKSRKLDDASLKEIYDDSPLGRMLATGLINMHHPREVMKERVEDTGRHVIHELERF